MHRRFNGVAALLLLISLVTFSYAGSQRREPQQLDAQSWIPLQVGGRWTYEMEWKSGDRQHPTVERWTSDEVVSDVVQTPQGWVVIKDVKAHGKAVPSFIAAWSGSSFLLHNNCIYFLGTNDWDGKQRQIGRQFNEALKSGTAEPDLCFPMETGRKWGGADTNWRVIGFGRSQFADPAYADSFQVTGRIGSSGPTDLWYAKGTGIVAIHYLHQGAYDEYTKRLKAFQRR